VPQRASGHDEVFCDERRQEANHFLNGQPNPIFTRVFPDCDFATTGYWFWLKSSQAHGFDVKSFDEKYIYMRATELEWKDRFDDDLPIAARCVVEGKAGPELKIFNTRFQYFASCRPYKSSNVGSAVNDLDAPVLMDAGSDLATSGRAYCTTTTTVINGSNIVKTRNSCISGTVMACGNGNTLGTVTL